MLSHHNPSKTEIPRQINASVLPPPISPLRMQREGSSLFVYVRKSFPFLFLILVGEDIILPPVSRLVPFSQNRKINSTRAGGWICLQIFLPYTINCLCEKIVSVLFGKIAAKRTKNGGMRGVAG